MDKTILYEVDIQNDFMDEGGRLYVPGAEGIKDTIREAASVAIGASIRRVRSRDRHFADDPELEENGGPFPRHCMDRSYGMREKDGTFGVDFSPALRAGTAYVVERKTAEHGDIKTYSPAELETIVKGSRDIVIDKQHYDVFTNPTTEPLLKALGVTTAIVDGVATDYCVKAAVLGMQRLGIQTYVLEDAISGIAPEGIEAAVAEMKGAGARFAKVGDLYRIARGA